ncbi:uncharacterized protein RAG0_07559 [Rhynchosporium agropyri]|uniref:Apple domain-containing protein n=1 Tax=Rhynchosporium agropyri TaxID=914238 RepID=A0A1E1KM25_9HELO|nr:uncharacterized protein RAG0_07559 [Rhynchosporium agropyri]
MAPSALSSSAALLLLSVSVASAAVSCTLNAGGVPGSTCGVFGQISTVDYYLEDLFVETTAETCSAACAARPSCLSFNLADGNFCELATGTQRQLGFVASDADPWYKGYDMTCFTCTGLTSSSSSTVFSSTISSSSSSSSLAPSITSSSSSVVSTISSSSSSVASSTSSSSVVSTTSSSSSSVVSASSASSSSVEPNLTASTSGLVEPTISGSSSSIEPTSTASSSGSVVPTISGSSSSTEPTSSYSSVKSTISSVVSTGRPTSFFTFRNSTTSSSSPTSTKSGSIVLTTEAPSSTSSTSGTTSIAVLTTSTVYATSFYTITSCALGIVNCPFGSVTTKTIALYTTICPVSATPTKPVSTSGATPFTTSTVPTSVATPLTTSTVYATSVYTITKCAPGVKCDVGYATTEIISLYTTVCPATQISATSMKGVPHSSAPAVPGHSAPAGHPEVSVSTVMVYPTGPAAGAVSSPVVPETYPTKPVEEPVPNSSLVTIQTNTIVPTYPTAAAVPVNNGTATSQSSAKGNVGTASIYLSVTGIPTATPSPITSNAGNALGAKCFGMAVVGGLIGAALL